MNSLSKSYASQRTEDHILAHAPIELKFGDKLFEVNPLPIIKNAAWRKKMVEAMKRMAGSVSLPLGDMNSFMAGFMSMFFEFPEVVLELVFEYGPALPRTEIQNIATDEQVVLAFSRVMAVAYPFFGLLRTMQEVTKIATPSASTSLL